MEKLRTLKAALITGGLFFILFLAWLKLDEVYTTETAPTSFEVVGFLEKNDFKTLPGLVLKDLNQTDVNLEALTKDKIVILNFWASWCEPCAEEFPSMVKLLNHFKGKVVILAPSHDSSLEDIKTFAEAFSLDKVPEIHLLWDKDQTAGKAFQVNKLPESYIFGKDGKLLRKVVGTRDWFNEDARVYFSTLLERN
jgi:cytochrome c biogenesis protein CcmG, thiol:disulfide interchange protein DsbE